MKKSLIIIFILLLAFSFIANYPTETYIFYSPHQDDETLFMSAGILDALDSGKRVVVVCMTDGSKSVAINKINKNLKDEGRKEISIEEFIDTRNEEFKMSLKELGVREENIFFMNYVNEEITYEEIQEVVLNFNRRYMNPTNLTLIGNDLCFSEKEKETHFEHRLIGDAIFDLFNSHKIRKASFFSYIEPHNENTEKLSLNKYQIRKYHRALDQYGVWDPDNKKYSVGHISVTSFFEYYRVNPVLEYYEFKH
ncbi:MAG: hypothetical protein CSB16_00850 [Clostridiales bacterium]|nr:MAG: hypothetical protein CSB16_00850 [Clostridiales bacterium]